MLYTVSLCQKLHYPPYVEGYVQIDVHSADAKQYLHETFNKYDKEEYDDY